MREYLLFRLHGALMSWGGIAAGELRPTQDHATKSAVLGLLGAALGLRRQERDAHRALTEQLHMATCVLRPGEVVEDFHTIQAPRGKTARGLTRRVDELDYDKIGTITSRRQYLCDQIETAAVWLREEAEGRWTLEDLREALTRPHWTLYLGRKSCPPVSPLEPQLLEADHLLAALRAASFVSDHWLFEDGEQWYGRDASLTQATRPMLYWDHDAPQAHVGLSPQVSAMRRDLPLDRQRWHFARRREASAPLPASD